MMKFVWFFFEPKDGHASPSLPGRAWRYFAIQGIEDCLAIIEMYLTG